MGIVRTPRKIKTSSNSNSYLEVKTGLVVNPNESLRKGTVKTGNKVVKPFDNDQSFTK